MISHVENLEEKQKQEQILGTKAEEVKKEQPKNMPEPQGNIIEDPLEEKRLSIQENMPKKRLSFTERQNIIKNLTYKVGKKKKDAKRKKRSKYMKAVLKSMDDLDAALNQPFSTDEKQQQKIHDLFLNACAACEKYIKKRNPYSDEGQARFNLVKEFFDQISWESMHFMERCEAASKVENENDRPQTYIDVLADVRTQKYENGKGGVKITKGGAGTSSIFIVEKDGKKQYFKQNENVESYGVMTQLRKKKSEFQEKLAEAREKNVEEKENYEAVARYLNQIEEGLLWHLQRGIAPEEMARSFANANNAAEIYNYVKENIEEIEELQEMEDDFVVQRDELQKIKEKVEALEAKRKKDDPQTDEEKELRKEFAEKRKKIEQTPYVLLRDTLWEVSKGVLAAKIATNTVKMNKGDSITKRNAATSRLAKLLGVEDTIVRSEMTEITIEGKTYRGVMMDEAEGDTEKHTRDKYKKEKMPVRYSPDAMRQLLSLQVLDLLCGQTDRHGNNYLVKTREIEKNGTKSVVIDKITGIDNDMSFGVLFYSEIEKEGEGGYAKMKNIEHDGKFMLPAMDKELAAKILAIEAEFIHHLMADLLGESERIALIDRIKGVQNAIRTQLAREKNMKEKNQKFATKFIPRDKWEVFRDYHEKRMKSLSKNDRVQEKNFSYLMNMNLIHVPANEENG